MKTNIINFLSRIFDRNPISYKCLRECYRAWKGEDKLEKGLRCIAVLPFIPFFNYKAKKEIENIRKNENQYSIRNGTVTFYLPDLDLVNGEFIQNRIFLEQNYFEIFHLSQIKKYVRKNAVILDIGANLGNHTVFFAKECGAKRIYAFEPTWKTFQILEENIKINNLDSIVVAMNIALGEKDARVNIIVNTKDAGSNHVEENIDGNVIMNTLDGLSLSDRIDFIKIDVEGYEFEVLKGAMKTLAQNHPDIFIEIFDKNYDKVHTLLTQMGYKRKLKMEQDYLYQYKIN